MKKSKKTELVGELKDKLSTASAVYYTDFTGLNVKRMTDLRHEKVERIAADYPPLETRGASSACAKAAAASWIIRSSSFRTSDIRKGSLQEKGCISLIGLIHLFRYPRLLMTE